ncbi:MAG: helix-turn-helix transcriptional regulator [bacterium]|nr:helix-turn-helix transcriptional regulator [bacterium]
MKKIEIAEKDLRGRTFEEMFTKLSRNKGFLKAYVEERARRRLAKQIRELRIAQHLTQKTVAKRADMPQSVIARIESGDRAISVETLGRIAHTFGKEVQLV